MVNTPQTADFPILPASLPDAAPQAALPAVPVLSVKPRATPVKRPRTPAVKTATETTLAPQSALKQATVKKVPAKPALAQKTTDKAVAPKAAIPKAAIPKTGASKATALKAAAPAKADKQPAAAKSKKEKLVRDSFTIPKSEFAVLDELKQRTTLLARSVKKSELLRAGIKVLASLSDVALLSALSQVPTIKTGRPALKK